MKFINAKTVALTATLACAGTFALPESICGQQESQPLSGQQIIDPSGAPQQQMKPKSFIMKTAADNKLEIALGQLAQLRAENPQVRQFGQQVVQAHHQSNQKLDGIAQAQGVPLDLQQFAQMIQASGPQFDQAYVRFLSQEGRTGIQMLQQIADRHPDQEIKQFARDQVAQMQQNLQQVQRVQTQLQAGGQIREPAGAEPTPQSSASPESQQAAQQQHYYSQLEQRAEGRHYPAGEQGAIIREQAGAESQQQLQQQVRQLQQQLQQLQLQVQQLQRNQGQGVGQHLVGQPGAPAGQMELPEAREFLMTGATYAKLCGALSQVAMERAQSPEVRQLAQQQQQVGEQVAQRLQQIAQKHGVQMDVQRVKQLTQARGREFDQAYLGFVVEEHRRAIEDLQRAAKQQTDLQLQQFAQAQIQDLQKHLDQAQRLQTQIQASGEDFREPAGSQPREYRDLRELLKP